MAQSRLIEKPDLGFWRDMIERLNASAFCRGEVENRDGRLPWLANFEFLVRPTTYAKILEGMYRPDSDASSGKSYLEQWREQQRAEGKL